MTNKFITNISFKTAEEKASFDKLAKIHGFPTIKKFVVQAAKTYSEKNSNPLIFIYEIEKQAKKMLSTLEKNERENTQAYEGARMILQIIARLDIVKNDPENWQDFKNKKGFRFFVDDLPFLDNELI